MSATIRTQVLDTERIRLNAYLLAGLFFANREILRQSDPASPGQIAGLEEHFFVREMTQLLLPSGHLAACVRRPNGIFPRRVPTDV
jgi:hypothetical protein